MRVHVRSRERAGRRGREGVGTREDKTRERKGEKRERERGGGGGGPPKRILSCITRGKVVTP